MNAGSARLTWGIKSSLLRYLASIPDIRSSVTDGADVDDDGRYEFEVVHVGDESPVVTVACQGSVRFVGHHGALRIGITDPVVTITGSEMTLSVVDHRVGESRGGADEARLDLAVGSVQSSSPSEGTCRFSPVKLTASGAESLFDGVYSGGEILDAIDLILPPRTGGKPHEKDDS